MMIVSSQLGQGMIRSALMHNNANRGYLICLTGTVLLSSTGVLIRYLTETYQLPSLILALWRDIFVSLALGTALSLLTTHLRKKLNVGWRFLIFYGFILAVFNTIWTASVALNGAAVATVLAYSSAAFTAFLDRRIFGESLGLSKLTAVILCLVGCVLVAGAYDITAWGINPLGILTGLLSGLAYAVYSLMGKATANRGDNAWSVLFYTFTFASGFLLLFNIVQAMATHRSLLPDLFWLGSSLTGWGALVFLAVGPTIGGFGFYMLSMGYLPASIANLIATLEPALTAILAYLLLKEQLTPEQLAGSCVILLGVILLRLREWQRQLKNREQQVAT
jgi:DME family drug/metabolite transporter